MVMAGSWEKVSKIVESEVTRRGSRYSLVYRLENLEVATDYMAVVRVRNKYGWSAESERFSFFTKRGILSLVVFLTLFSREPETEHVFPFRSDLFKVKCVPFPPQPWQSCSRPVHRGVRRPPRSCCRYCS